MPGRLPDPGPRATERLRRLQTEPLPRAARGPAADDVVPETSHRSEAQAERTTPSTGEAERRTPSTSRVQPPQDLPDADAEPSAG
ncbi:hypothetical protein [Cellulomonas aerilata]|uniref:Uncharacterized protein n=1 Tax=Cellulomonas aerilata TaxID=515326 RepID=A0A512DHB6_9CELL|nr:hypothetical protein [Cellulomonas aerilata]GEO35580.1 hypothetical protein CAE01nite_33050 [Cellulomonas aerilata]